MLDILQQKLLSWTPEKADEFFSNLTRFNLRSNRIWEVAPTGYFLYDSTFSGYFDNNGESYILTAGDKVEEYTIKQQLSDASTTIAIEKPKTIQAVTVGVFVYTYVEQTRPFNTLGLSALNLVQTKDNQADAITNFVAQNFKAAEQYINLLDTVINTPSENIYPFAIPIENLYYDPATENYFFVGEFANANAREEFISRTADSFKNIEYYLNQMFGTIKLTQPLEDLLKLCPTFQQV